LGDGGTVITVMVPPSYQRGGCVRTAYRIDIPPALMSIDVHSTGIYVTGDL